MAGIEQRELYMRKFSIPLLITLCLYAFSSAGQDPRTQEYLRQEEQRKHSETLRQLDSGVYFMDHSEYILADEKFRYVLRNIRSVPSDLTFYFGKNSFFLKEYKQSIDWLNKYIQLKGTTGQFYEEATSWLRKAEAEYLKEKTQAAGKTKELLSKNYDTDLCVDALRCDIDASHYIQRFEIFIQFVPERSWIRYLMIFVKGDRGTILRSRPHLLLEKTAVYFVM